MKKIWIKETKSNETYYYIASPAAEVEIHLTKSLTKKSIESMIDRGGFVNRELGKYLDLRFISDKLPVEVEHLPPGSYRLKDGEPGKPLRLEIMNVRDDGYIPLTDHMPLITDINHFLKSKPIFDKLQFNYRRGYLLYGEPGTGKTAFIRHLVQQPTLKDAHIIWIDFIPPTEIIDALNEIDGLKILIMEELIQETGTLSYDMREILQFLDGEKTIMNSIIIGTTNYPQFLHKNLADRPSRFDVLYEMKKQSSTVILQVLERWLERTVETEEVDYNSVNLAQLKEICLLHKFYDISLKEAAMRLKKQGEKFKTGFEAPKSMGLNQDGD